MIAEIKDIRSFLHYSAHSRFWHLGLNRFSPRLIRGVISSLLFEALLRRTNGVEMDMDIIHCVNGAAASRSVMLSTQFAKKNYKLTPSLRLKIVVLEEKHHFILHLRTFHPSATN